MILSQLTALVEQYLAVRMALGFTTRVARPLLHEFLAFLATQPPLVELPARIAFEWACGHDAPRGITSRAARLRVVRGFLTYAKVSLPTIDIPAPGLLSHLRRSSPYLFTPEDLTRLLTAATHLPSRSGWTAVLYPHLLGLLASCGLRTGEALRLHVSDVNLEADPPYLHIRSTKFRKSRLVPLYPTVVVHLHDYLHLRHRFLRGGGAATFFVSDRGAPLGYDGVQAIFQRLVHQLALAPHPGQRRPTLHSLRHTFAVHRVLTWARQGLSVQDCLPHLSVYLGHRRPEDTYWYLTATPELLATAADAFQRYAERGGGQ